LEQERRDNARLVGELEVLRDQLEMLQQWRSTELIRLEAEASIQARRKAEAETRLLSRSDDLEGIR
jgi:hypothetical protein